MWTFGSDFRGFGILVVPFGIKEPGVIALHQTDDLKVHAKFS